MKRTHSEKIENVESGFRHYFDDGSFMEVTLKGVGKSTYKTFSKQWHEQRQAIRDWIISK